MSGRKSVAVKREVVGGLQVSSEVGGGFFFTALAAS